MDNVLALEEHVAENAEGVAVTVDETVVGLDAAEAGRAACRDRRVVDILAGHDLCDAADGNGEVGQRGAARENIAALSVVELCAGDLGVVGLDDGGLGVDKRGAGVEN